MCDNRRKRVQKTSPDQYEEYLRCMEEDQIFRTGKINPTVSPNYIQNCWRELTTRLNASGNGPALTPPEWKKRFNDWKNSTRAKYRKIFDERQRTGGGCSGEILLSPLEERGLSVWGRVTVTGTPNVLVSGGFLNSQASSSSDLKEHLHADVPEIENIEEENEENFYMAPQDNVREEIQVLAVVPTEEKQRKVPKRTLIRKTNKTSSRSVRSIGEDFLNIYRENISTHERNKLDLEERKIILEERKLRFEIAKYKFENPSFHFDE